MKNIYLAIKNLRKLSATIELIGEWKPLYIVIMMIYLMPKGKIIL